MKTQLVFFSIMVSIITTKIQAQQRTIVNASNSEISDNLDLRAISSVFGDSNNLQDFERRLNNPKLQISNLDLNNDNQVDYLRVIEYVKNRTHIVVIQSVLDRDLYQDVATIEVEKDNYNTVHLQIIGDSYLYGQNYIYEPVYYNTPLIYASFWLSNYRPYNSIWSWNYYPSYYYSWNPFPVFRYRNNIHNCLNSYNIYNYVSNRRSIQAEYIYNSRRANGYERQYPNYSFSKRNTQFDNRHELEQRRNSTENYRTEVNYSQFRTENQRGNSEQRNESPRVAYQNNTGNSRMNNEQRNENSRVYSQNRTQNQRVNSEQRNETPRIFSQNRTENSRVNSTQRNESSKVSNQNRTENSRSNSTTRTESRRDNSNSSRNENRR